MTRRRTCSRSRTTIDEGERFDRPDVPMGQGMTSRIITTGRPVRVGSDAEAVRRVPSRSAGRRPSRGSACRSSPATGSSASSPSSASSSTRTPRPTSGSCRRSRRAWAWRSRTPDCSGRPSACWPRPTSGRRSWPSSTRSATALAKQLEFEAIIELVGERVRAIFEVRVDVHRAVRRRHELHRVPVRHRRGASASIAPSLRARTGHHLDGDPDGSTAARSGTVDDQVARGAIQVGGSDTESWLGVPILAGERVIGVIALESLDAERVRRGDERLLATLASSMGVALENARLFGETKRLLTETDERAAELAIINERPARPRRPSSTCRRCTRSSGTRSRRSSTRRSSTSGSTITRPRSPTIRTRSSAATGTPTRRCRSIEITRAFIAGRRTVVHDDVPAVRAGTRGDAGHPGRASPVDGPRAADDRRRGPRQHLAAEPRPDARVLGRGCATPDDPRGQPQRRARERAADRRDAAACRGARHRQPGQPGDLRRSSTSTTLLELVGEQMRQTFSADIVFVALKDEAEDVIQFPYHIEHGVREPQDADADGQRSDVANPDDARAAPAQPGVAVRPARRCRPSGHRR